MIETEERPPLLLKPISIGGAIALKLVGMRGDRHGKANI